MKSKHVIPPRDKSQSASDRRLEKLLWANNIIFPAALILSAFFRYATLFALLFWLYVLLQLIRRDVAAKQISVATIFYAVAGLAITAFVIYVLIYSALY